MSEEKERRYVTLAPGTDDINFGPRKPLDYEKLCKEFGAAPIDVEKEVNEFEDVMKAFKPYLDESNPDEVDHDLEFVDFEEPDEDLTERSMFLRNIKGRIGGIEFIAVTMVAILIGYILVRCIRVPED